jgi:hypothetical protein
MSSRPFLPTTFGSALRAVTAAVATAAVVMVGFAAPAAAAPPVGALRGPSDPISLALTGPSPDFGFVKEGRVIVRDIELLNDGMDGLVVDPAPLASLTSPFTLVSTTIVAGDEIDPGETRTIRVSYLAPTAGTTSLQPIVLTLNDADAPGMSPYTLNFRGQSLATDRSAFELSTSDGRAVVDFGSIRAGQTVTKTLVVTVRGVDPLRFMETAVTIRNAAGMPLGVVTLTRSTFGTGRTLNPGESAVFDLTFRPTVDGTFAGSVTVTGQANGDPEASNVTQSLPITAVALTPATPTPTPTPTPMPTPSPTPTPTGTSVPTPGSTSRPAPGGSGSNSSSGGGSGTSGGSGVAGNGRRIGLAETGAEQVTGVAGGALAVLLSGTALLVILRRGQPKKSR